MIITVNESIIGELFFSLPEPEELTKAEEQISYICRSTLNDEESSRLEYELEQMKKTKTAFHFLYTGAFDFLLFKQETDLQNTSDIHQQNYQNVSTLFVQYLQIAILILWQNQV